jgi:hypothetical protein
MNRQLQADGGIMQVAPREKFGLGSKLKKFVRKIIPNEVADIAVKAAPFVAPFNPAVAAAMAGLGSFDQTGKIGSSLKRGALTYGGGQAARYLGGAGFQGNPFGDGGAFTGSGFKSGFSTPFGSDTGLGKFFSNRGTEGVQAIDSSKPLKKPLNIQAGDGSIDLATGGADGFGIIQDTVVDKSIVTQNDPGFLKNLFDGISNQDYGKVAKTIGDGAKKFGKAMFTNKDGSIDKAAVMGAITFATSYAEALALANDAGMDLTEEEYNEARKDEKKAEYAGYLTNFFAGKKDGGRIGFESGANEMIKTQLLEEIMPDTSTEDFVIIMTEDGPVKVKKSDLPPESMMMDTSTGFGTNITRVDRKFGSPEEGESEVGIMTIDVEAGDDEDEEDMMMAYSDAIFNRPEKAALFRALGDPKIRQTTKSFKNLNNILKNPGMFPEDELVLKQYLKLKGFKDGGRIGYKGGANRVSELLILRDEKIGKGEDVSDIEAEIFQLTGKTFKSVGGISDIPTGKMRKNNAGVVERDYRDEGGFVPVGIKERADDVPAMLSKNEFVMTADAVRGIGNGSVEEGSKKLYNTMKQAEKVGKA